MPTKTKKYPIELSHLRCRIRWTRTTGQVTPRAATVERRTLVDRVWRRMHDMLVPDHLDLYPRAEDIDALAEKMQGANEYAQRQLNLDAINSAKQELEHLQRRRKKKAAKQKMRKWLNGLPLTADGYKESPRRWSYGHGEEGREARKKSVFKWMRDEARRRWPEEYRNARKEILGTHDLSSGVMLV